MPVLIYQRRDDYVHALRSADTAEAAGQTDVSEMETLLRDALTEQLSSAVHRISWLDWAVNLGRS
jgi:hypothetical protein